LLGLVVAGWVELEVADEFTGGGVDDSDVEVFDDEDDGGAGEGSADADVVHAAGSAEADGAGGVDVVVADSVMGAVGWVGPGFGEEVVDNSGCPAVDASVRPVVVVDGSEGVTEVQEFVEVGRVGPGARL